MEEKKLSYLEGLRGFGAIMVFLCHFVYAFYYTLYSCDIANSNLPFSLETGIAVSPLNFFYNGKSAVRIFFLVSGYVISIKYFKSHDRGYLKKSAIKRYFRLVVPIAAIEIISYVMMKAGLFYNVEASVISKSEWFAYFYNFEPTFYGALRESLFACLFKGENIYSGVLWIMKYEFLGSLIAYLTLFLIGKNKFRYIIYAIELVFLLVIDPNYGYAAVLLGMIICDIMNTKREFVDKICRNKFILLIMFLTGIFLASYPAAGVGLENTIYSLLGSPRVILFYTAGCSILFFVLLNSSLMQRLLDNKFLNYLGRYSMGIYMVHFPVIASFSAWLLILLSNVLSYNLIMLLNLILSAVIVVLLGKVFTCIVEPIGKRLSDFIIKLVGEN